MSIEKNRIITNNQNVSDSNVNINVNNIFQKPYINNGDYDNMNNSCKFE